MSIADSALEVLRHCADWLAEGHGVTLVTVVETWGSSPRPPGSMAAVRDDGVLAGSVSGGCVEKRLVEQFTARTQAEAGTAQDGADADTAPRINHMTVSDTDARRYGLSCGGSLSLVFESLHDADSIVGTLQHLDARQRVVRCVDLETGRVELSVGSRDDHFACVDGRLRQVFGPDWRLLLIGAGELSRFTAEFALALDYEVLVCEPRTHFRSAWTVSGTQLLEAACMPDEAVQREASDARSMVLALTHDPELDDLALLEALPAETFHVGALGSTRSHAKRCQRLKFMGLDAGYLERISAPVGLSIGSRTAPEIAISIMAEIVAVRAGVVQDPQRPTSPSSAASVS